MVYKLNDSPTTDNGNDSEISDSEPDTCGNVIAGGSSEELVQDIVKCLAEELSLTLTDLNFLAGKPLHNTLFNGS